MTSVTSKSKFAKFGVAPRCKTTVALWLVLWVLGLGVSASAQEGTFVTFDAPGAGTGADQGTYAQAVNPAGVITGYYYDTNSFAHGFVRAADGTITTFDPPGSTGTFAYAINTAGVIAGEYFDASFVEHGFVRPSNGSPFTTFDVVRAVERFGFTVAGIDTAGAVTGYYQESEIAPYQGFLRAADGAITTFDAPGAGTGFFQGTRAFGINPQGTVAGCYADANSVGHGFVRATDGTLTEWDLPNSAVFFPGCAGYSFAFLGFMPLIGISPPGTITGAYFQPISGNPYGGNYRGFLRATDGSFTTFDAVPSPSSPCCTWTAGIAINPAGVIAGFDNDYDNVNHGFVRASNGTVTILDAPGAGTGYVQGTFAVGITPAGQVMGQDVDANSVFHGLLWTPPAQ